MLVLGLSGNFSARDSDLVPLLPDQVFHDSAACLVRDGEVIAAVEEERFNRIKKTTKFPVNAIRACLDEAGVTVDQLDGVAYYFPEEFVDTTLNFFYTVYPKVPTVYCRQLIKQWFAEEFDWELSDDKLVFTPHHDAHAIAAVARSGMPESLVLVLDGRGEENSGTVYREAGGQLEKLADYPIFKSLGMLYLNATQLLGYGFGDEYKVMGLAPYGDPATFRDALSSLYMLADNGDYHLLPNMTVPDLVGPSMLTRGITPRRKGEPFTQQHKDLAAATQEALEKIVMHVLSHWAESTGLSRLCFGGGVAHGPGLQRRRRELPGHDQRPHGGRRQHRQQMRDRAPPRLQHQHPEYRLRAPSVRAQHRQVHGDQHRQSQEQLSDLGLTVDVLEHRIGVLRRVARPQEQGHVGHERDQHQGVQQQAPRLHPGQREHRPRAAADPYRLRLRSGHRRSRRRGHAATSATGSPPSDRR
ncbi:carbamoyltransferase N-terminal domain-containing protein [Streptomyces scabiei]|uniref:carbamoyltransferase N-terminal domain-containing protein n=1 Tax=Streptomyces scabiei TaxID=1930 RepID=UPI000A52EC32|nr:carbamoyltransferase N-terminal domain-containing protein [Streptomyces scabiei]